MNTNHKVQSNGLIIPDLSVKKTINDFDPATPQEIMMNMVIPINEALGKGIPPNQPTAVPLEAMARLLRTITNMASVLEQTELQLVSLLKEEDFFTKTQQDVIRKLPLFSQFAVLDLENIGKDDDKPNNE